MFVQERRIRIKESKILITLLKCFGKRKQHAGIIFMHAFNNFYIFLVYKICTEYYDRGQQICKPLSVINTHMIISPAHSSMHTITNITHCIHIVLESTELKSTELKIFFFLQEGFLKVSEGSESPFVAEKIESNPKIQK